MYQIIKFKHHDVRLHSYQAAGTNTFNYCLEVRPEYGHKTPDWNDFGCGFSSLSDATKAMRKSWSVIKERETLFEKES